MKVLQEAIKKLDDETDTDIMLLFSVGFVFGFGVGLLSGLLWVVVFRCLGRATNTRSVFVTHLFVGGHTVRRSLDQGGDNNVLFYFSIVVKIQDIFIKHFSLFHINLL